MAWQRPSVRARLAPLRSRRPRRLCSEWAGPTPARRTLRVAAPSPMPAPRRRPALLATAVPPLADQLGARVLGGHDPDEEPPQGQTFQGEPADVASRDGANELVVD